MAIPVDTFNDFFDTLVQECGVNAKYREEQRTAWYRRFSFKSPDVIRRAFSAVALSTKHSFPTLAEVSEAIRQAEIRANAQEDEGHDDCNICAGHGFVFLIQQGKAFHPNQHMPSAGKPFLFKCTCGSGKELSHNLPEFTPSILHDFSISHRIGGLEDVFTRTEGKAELEKLKARMYSELNDETGE